MIPETISGRKWQIYSVAQNLFRERGFSATSMRDIARTVGIEPASLYSHITSKEEILRDICFGIASQFFTAIEEVNKENIPADQKLKAAIFAHIAVIKDNLDASVVFLHEWRFLSEPELSLFKSQRKEYEEYFKNILLEGKESGIFSDINIKVILPTIFSTMNWAYEWYKPGGTYSTENLGEEIFNMIFKGIKA